MKKFVTIALSLALVLCMAFSFGCNGSDSTFSGDYKEATAEEVQNFATTISDTGSEVDMSKGVEVSISMSSTEGSEYEKIKMEYKAISKDGKLQMEGNMLMDSDETGEINAKLYFDDNKLYTAVSSQGVEVKTYIPIGLDDYVNGYFGGITDMRLSEILDQYKSFSNQVGFYIDETGNDTKVKIEITDLAIRDSVTNGEMVFVYDENNALIAVKFSLKTVETDDLVTETEEIEMTIKGWTGNIDLPSDLNEYVSIGSIGGLM